jgi:hypothetical protein
MVLKEWPIIPNTMFIAWMVLTWCVEFLGVQSGWMVANETIYINLQPTLEASHHFFSLLDISKCVLQN